ncbi:MULTISPECIES: FimV/HubP family polar landmark protein [unclassified Burkholderia]|uniref:FimV/HubP family polar landmark protein n=1 Tax=unclassified Burkholderia TaxID=2613784 RepID=UPI00075CC67E|nr:MULTISPECIES: FimV/HubP family polar landmark protein [unclassified Burkholderia]KUZ00473.1 pilus assembly protein FimV [Burkholderia sp. RF7-non_BP1]KUZ04249.1 pilus assembly protein FimV [Burkholderia sp. RF7-non_BP4]
MSRISLFPRQSRLSRAVRGALAILALGAAASAWAAGTVELPASAAGGPAPLTVTVQPGQSLNDLAKAATQSHDPGVLARAGRALFDANPQAFMKRDPSRLKVGATLTVPALDATGAALAAAGASGASGASAASAVAAASSAAAAAAVATQHGASAPHPGSAVQTAPAAHAAPVSGASVAAAAVVAGASASTGASAAHGASTVEPVQPAAPAAGASGPHVWSGAIQSATPSSASEAAIQPAQGGQAQGMHEPSAAAPVAGASQPRPSSLQQLLALKNRVLMELQKHGIGKPAATNNVAPAPAPAAPRPAANDGASAAASSPAASEAASGEAASAAQPASAPVQPAAPVTATPLARDSEQIDWRPAAAAGAAVVVLAAGFAWRKRRKARRAEAVAAESGGAAASDAGASSSPVEPVPPILPETPVARDAAADVNLVSAAAVAAEVAETRDLDVPSSPEAATPSQDDQKEAPAAPAAEPAPHDAKPAAPATNDDQHAALMQNAISALNSLDMPLPPRTAEEPAAREGQAESEQVATNGQSASHPPVGANDPLPEHPVDQDDEFDWDPDASTPAPRAGGASAPSSLPPLGGAQFGALKLDFDLDLPSAPGAVLPALTPEELARIARNKLDLASEYVELGDLSGARTLLQEVVDANDAATRDDARALLAKLAEEA